MDSLWTELEITLPLEIQDEQKAELEVLTGCSPLLLRPLLGLPRVATDPQRGDGDQQYAQMIEYLYTALEMSDEVSSVRNNISAFVADKYAKLSPEPVRWKL